MPVLERSELEASPLADLHAIADQLGLDGFRRLRKASLIDTILGEESPADGPEESSSGSEENSASERSAGTRRRGGRSRRSGASAGEDAPSEETAPPEKETAPPGRRGRSRASREDTGAEGTAPEKRRRSRSSSREDSAGEQAPRAGRSRAERGAKAEAESQDGESSAEGVVELLGNGSAFLRIDPPEPSDGDVYISAAQVRRCELVSGDRVSGPVRTPRRSERYPSLVRIDTINGDSADAVSSGARFEDLPAAYPSERFALESKDPTLEAIEWLTPFGRGSRVLIVGAARSGKTETLRGLLAAISAGKDLEVTLVLAGSRPEEISQWQQGAPPPAAALSFAASSDSQGQAVERALDAAKRVAARGAHAVVLIDSLDGLHPHAARKALAAARNITDGGSLTVIATATRPFGGESTVIALDVALTSTGRQPIIDLTASGTLKPELLVGEDGAKAITQAHAGARD